RSALSRPSCTRHRPPFTAARSPTPSPPPSYARPRSPHSAPRSSARPRPSRHVGGAEGRTLEHGGPVRDQLEPAVEEAALDQLEPDVEEACKDGFGTGGSGNHREHDGADPVDESRRHQCSAERYAAEGAQRAGWTPPS